MRTLKFLWKDEGSQVSDCPALYLSRRGACDQGLTRAFDGRDWWLLDDQRLILMTFDHEGRRTRTELLTDEEAARQACHWRDLAIQAAGGRHG